MKVVSKLTNTLIESLVLTRASELLKDNPDDKRYAVAVASAKSICSVVNSNQLGVVKSSDDKVKFNKLISKFSSTSIIKSSKLGNSKLQSGTINDVVVVVLTVFIENDDNPNNYTKYRYIMFDANDYKDLVSNNLVRTNKIPDEVVDSTDICIKSDNFISQMNEYFCQYFNKHPEYIPFKITELLASDYEPSDDTLVIESII